MKAGIIAAGLGERFRNAGFTTPKPLLVVAGKTLVERAIDTAAAAGAEEVALIVNAEYPEVKQYVRDHRWPVPVRLTVKTTASSMESFFMLEPYLRDSPFLLSTVDAITSSIPVTSLVIRDMTSPKRLCVKKATDWPSRLPNICSRRSYTIPWLITFEW